MKELLKRWNSWWVHKKVPKNKTRITRQDLLNNLLKLSRPKEIIVLKGVRRSGKSTLIYQIIDNLLETVNPNNILYFNFDEPLEIKDINLLENVYKIFLELNNPKGRKYVFFDEIQNIPQWEKWLKKYYDLYGEEIKFIITGSNSTMLSDKLSTLLTGRILTKEIYPLSFNEFLHFNNILIKDLSFQKEEIEHFLSKYLIIGGFPEVVLETDSEITHHRLKEYFDSILLRDIVTSQNIRETAKLRELAIYSMTNISSILSYNKMSKALKINIHTLKEYLSFMENAYLIFQLRFFSYSLKESIMLQKPRKIFSIDTGLRNEASFKFSKDTGKLAENLVFIEMKRRNSEIYYWQGKNEVDFIVKNKDDTLTAINVVYGEINEREIKGLLEFKKKFKNAELMVLTKDTEKKEEGIKFIPIWKWLLAG
ncbi:MAG: ATP-binding protein [Candidatus Nanoarchaeia archaeon]